MTIGEVQFRIAHIQSIMTAAGGPARAATAARATTSTAGVGAATPAAAGTAAAPSSAVAFAAALQNATAATAASATGAPAVGATGWTAPARGKVSSEYGPRWGTQHQGIDIAAGSGSTVSAVSAGTVRKASWYGGYGNAVIIDHGGGVSTLYGHNSKLAVKPGDKVRAGQKIAEVGSTGDSTGPHLHFEVEVKGKKVDPRPWLKQRGVTL